MAERDATAIIDRYKVAFLAANGREYSGFIKYERGWVQLGFARMRLAALQANTERLEQFAARSPNTSEGE